MISTLINKPKIHTLIERFFIIAGLVILIATLLVGLYLNKYDEQENQKSNLKKIHVMLSQLIVPSLIISDLTEVRRMLSMASGDEEAYLVIDNDGTIIMPDYEKSHFSKFVSDSYKFVNDCKHIEITYKYINKRKYLINCSILEDNDVLSGGRKIGVLLSFTDYKWFSFSPIIFYFVGILIGLFLILIILLRRMLYRHLLKPLITLKDRILDISIAYMCSGTRIDQIENAPRELVEIKEAFERLLLNWQEEHSRRTEAEKMKALIDLSAGVAHDIRSPLIALDIVIKDILNIPEEKRIVIRNSVTRINDIANNLLTQYRWKKNTESDEALLLKPELLSDLLMSLVSEKRAQYRQNTINLVLNLEETTYGQFSQISGSEFNRVISNLIDNAIDALADEIQIWFRISNSEKDSTLIIQLQDNGTGISTEHLTKIVNGEIISNKTKGHGLGLSHAIKAIEKEWGGQFDIKSIVNIGTTIDIKLPQAPAPKWFLQKLIINPKFTIVILDDDDFIHQVWKNRFTEIKGDLNLIHYYNPLDLIKVHNDNPSSANIFLIDYEFVGSNKNGLNVIEELGISNNSYLVTSRYEDLNVREHCEKLGLKIIPKTLATHIPIILLDKNPHNSPDIIFIDDNVALTTAWALRGIANGKKIVTYNTIHALKIDLYKYDLNIPIYIDSDLNDVLKGQDFARELYEAGFRNIYLATGYSKEDFPQMFWIKKVVDKIPPF